MVLCFSSTKEITMNTPHTRKSVIPIFPKISKLEYGSPGKIRFGLCFMRFKKTNAAAPIEDSSSNVLSLTVIIHPTPFDCI